MVKIIKVEWIDKEEREADVTISDGTFSVVCYSCPFKLQEGEIFENRLYCLDVENILKTSEPEVIINGSDFYEYSVRGKLGDNRVVSIGELQVDVSDADIPGDICSGDMIEFSINRLDIY
jgi:hypothetical protein